MAFALTRRRLITAAVVAAGLQTGVLATMISSSAGILADGVAVRLIAQPVDPRDLLRGEYVVLGYEFSNLDAALLEGPWPEAAGEVTLNVRLAPSDDGYWHPVKGSFGELPAEEGTVVLRSLPFQYEPQSQPPAQISAQYGLERYYVPEGQGKVLEEARNDRQLVVTVHVTPEGEAGIASAEVVDRAP